MVSDEAFTDKSRSLKCKIDRQENKMKVNEFNGIILHANAP